QWGFSTDVPLRGDFDGDGRLTLRSGGPATGLGTSFEALPARRTTPVSSGDNRATCPFQRTTRAMGRPTLQYGDPGAARGTCFRMGLVWPGDRPEMSRCPGTITATAKPRSLSGDRATAPGMCIRVDSKYNGDCREIFPSLRTTKA